MDLWWSGKHHHHGGNIHVISAPDGWPLWTSPVRPGREHDTTCARTHAEILSALATWTGLDLYALGDLGYQGEANLIRAPFKNSTGARLTEAQHSVNLLHASLRAVAERANALLKMTFKAVRRVSVDPWLIGDIVAAALVLLHFEHDRTT